MTKTRIIKLSLHKFVSLLEKNGYIITSVYCEKENIRFVECKTPRFQKTFIINLPKKYGMKCPSDLGEEIYKRLFISKTDETPTSRQIEFISDIKGPLLECDVLAISSDMLCSYIKSQPAECFRIGQIVESDEDEEVEDEKGDEITSLEKETLSVLKKVNGSQAQLPKISLKEMSHSSSSKNEDILAVGEENEDEDIIEEEEEEDDDEDEEDEDIIDDEDADDEPQNVELEFEDENGDPIDEVKIILEESYANDAESSLREIEEKIDEKDIEYGIENTISSFNSLHPNIENEEIVLGVVFVLVDISFFFRNIKTYEEEVMKCYEHIHESETELRSKRLQKIKDMVKEFLSYSEQKIKNIEDEEKYLRSQLIRLSVVLAQTSSLQEKISKQPDKYGNVIAETEKIYEKTRETVHSVNMDLLKLRDTSDELLINYSAIVQELLEL